MEIDDFAKKFWAKTESLLQKISALDLLAAESDSLQCLGRAELTESMFGRQGPSFFFGGGRGRG